MTSAFSWKNSVSLCPASFYTPRPKLACYSRYVLLLTFAFQSPMMKRTPFVVVVSSQGLGGLHRTIQLQLLQHQWLSIDLDYCDIEWFALEMNRNHFVAFEIAPNYCTLHSSFDYEGYSISSKGFFPHSSRYNGPLN